MVTRGPHLLVTFNFARVSLVPIYRCLPSSSPKVIDEVISVHSLPRGIPTIHKVLPQFGIARLVNITPKINGHMIHIQSFIYLSIESIYRIDLSNLSIESIYRIYLSNLSIYLSTYLSTLYTTSIHGGYKPAHMTGGGTTLQDQNAFQNHPPCFCDFPPFGQIEMEQTWGSNVHTSKHF